MTRALGGKYPPSTLPPHLFLSLPILFHSFLLLIVPTPPILGWPAQKSINQPGTLQVTPPLGFSCGFQTRSLLQLFQREISPDQALPGFLPLLLWPVPGTRATWGRGGSCEHWIPVTARGGRVMTHCPPDLTLQWGKESSGTMSDTE